MSEPKKPKKPSRQQVFTLLVQIGRKDGDGLPDKATGAALMCFASGVDEAEAVRETVAILKQADTNPLDVTGYGTLDEREADGQEIDDEERELMARALEEKFSHRGADDALFRLKARCLLQPSMPHVGAPDGWRRAIPKRDARGGDVRAVCFDRHRATDCCANAGRCGADAQYRDFQALSPQRSGVRDWAAALGHS